MHRLYFQILFFLLLLCNISYSQQENTDVEIQLIDSYIATGNNERALTAIEDILAENPEHIEAQERKITLLAQEDRIKDAVKDIDGYLEKNPQQPEYLYLRAILNMQKQKYSKAIEDFDAALSYNMPEEYQYKVYLNRGMAHFYLQDYELANSDFDDVLERDENNATAYHGKGMIKYEEEDYENAIVEFQRSLRTDEDNPITHFNLAMTYFRLDDKENACYHFNKSCSLGHRNACRLLMMECDVEINID